MQTDNRSSAIQSLLQSGCGGVGRYRTDSDGRASEEKNSTDNRNVKIINVNYRHLLCYFYVLHTYGKDKMPFSIYIYIFFESPGKKSWPWQTRAREDG